MSNKNEYMDSPSGIYQDNKFVKQMQQEVLKQTSKISIPKISDIKNNIQKLKKYSEYSDDLHNSYANSNCINDLSEYYEYLLERSQNVK